MNEIERRKIVSTVNTKIKEEEELKSKYRELELLDNNPIVKRYKCLIKEIADTEAKVKLPEREVSIGDRMIIEASSTKNSCTHDIWVYYGSYYGSIWDDIKYRYFSEYDDVSMACFLYDKYVCLECGEVINTRNWETFEKRNVVLKTPGEAVDIFRYRNLYFSLLYANDCSSAVKKLVDIFNRDKEKPVERVRKDS